MITRGGIIAAGEGSRLQTKNKFVLKPMIPVNGKPLIEHAIQRFVLAGIKNLVIIFNEDGHECARYAKKTFPQINFDIIIKTTRSSFESFIEVGKMLGKGRHLISTVDSICSPEEFSGFKEKSEEYFTDGTVLAVTSFVDDEKPLWVDVDQQNKVIKLGGSSGKYVTAGMYVANDALFNPSQTSDKFKSLRQFLREIVDQGKPVCAYPFSKVIDVDRFEDIARAEMFCNKLTEYT